MTDNPYGGGGEDGAGGGAAGGDAQGGAGGAPGAPDPNGSAGGAPGDGEQGYRPDKLPDHLFGANDQETIDKLLGAYSGARDEIGKHGQVPEKPDDYELKWNDDQAKVFGDADKDEGVKIFRNLAHKHGLTAEQAKGLFEEYHAGVLEAGLVDTIDPAAEAKLLAGDNAARMSEQEITDAAAKRWNDAVTYIDGLHSQKVLSEDQAAVAKGLLETADGLTLIEALQKQSREQAINPGGDGGHGGSITEADLAARTSDPRNDPMKPEFDPAFEKETNRLYQSFYAGKQGQAA